MVEEKKRKGRPYEPDARHSYIRVRLTADEKEAIKELAGKSSGGTISSLVRDEVLKKGGA